MIKGRTEKERMLVYIEELREKCGIHVGILTLRRNVSLLRKTCASAKR